MTPPRPDLAQAETDHEADLAELAVVIPARQPPAALAELASGLRAAGFGAVIVVDDGSTGASREVFSELLARGVPVVRHAVNRGKGRALRSGFGEVLRGYPACKGVVTADADGQHVLADIVSVGEALAASRSDAIPQEPRAVLGVRRFDGEVPWRSRFGNTLTRLVFFAIFGVRLNDTQTGLRGLPVEWLPDLMALDGEHYEYEMAMLAHLCRQGRRPIEAPIRTVYLEANRGTHFKPVRDSVRIYLVLARSFVSSIRERWSRGFGRDDASP